MAKDNAITRVETSSKPAVARQRKHYLLSHGPGKEQGPGDRQLGKFQSQPDLRLAISILRSTTEFRSGVFFVRPVAANPGGSPGDFTTV